MSDPVDELRALLEVEKAAITADTTAPRLFAWFALAAADLSEVAAGAKPPVAAVVGNYTAAGGSVDNARRITELFVIQRMRARELPLLLKPFQSMIETLAVSIVGGVFDDLVAGKRMLP